MATCNGIKNTSGQTLANSFKVNSLSDVEGLTAALDGKLALIDIGSTTTPFNLDGANVPVNKLFIFRASWSRNTGTMYKNFFAYNSSTHSRTFINVDGDKSVGQFHEFRCLIYKGSDFIVIHNLNELEQLANKVTSLSSSSTDAQYPSAKCIYDTLLDSPEFQNSISVGDLYITNKLIRAENEDGKLSIKDSDDDEVDYIELNNTDKSITLSANGGSGEIYLDGLVNVSGGTVAEPKLMKLGTKFAGLPELPVELKVYGTITGTAVADTSSDITSGSTKLPTAGAVADALAGKASINNNDVIYPTRQQSLTLASNASSPEASIELNEDDSIITLTIGSTSLSLDETDLTTLDNLLHNNS